MKHFKIGKNAQKSKIVLRMKTFEANTFKCKRQGLIISIEG